MRRRPLVAVIAVALLCAACDSESDAPSPGSPEPDGSVGGGSGTGGAKGNGSGGANGGAGSGGMSIDASTDGGVDSSATGSGGRDSGSDVIDAAKDLGTSDARTGPIDAGSDQTDSETGATDARMPSVADNPPIPAGYKVMPQSDVITVISNWAADIMNHPQTYPMFSVTTMTFGSTTVLARVEWLPPDFQNNMVHRGVVLYVPI